MHTRTAHSPQTVWDASIRYICQYLALVSPLRISGFLPFCVCTLRHIFVYIYCISLPVPRRRPPRVCGARQAEQRVSTNVKLPCAARVPARADSWTWPERARGFMDSLDTRWRRRGARYMPRLYRSYTKDKRCLSFLLDLVVDRVVCAARRSTSHVCVDKGLV